MPFSDTDPGLAVHRWKKFQDASRPLAKSLWWHERVSMGGSVWWKTSCATIPG